MDPDYFGGDYYLRETQPIKGLGLARRIAHQSYRTEREFKTRFGRQVQPGEVLESGGRFAITSYLDHQADKLTKRFDANSYKVLTNAMSLFDVGLNRGGVLNTLSACNVPAVVVAISSDRLYPKYLQQELVDNLPNAKPLVEIDSDYGHDAFLLEVSGISSAIDLALEI
jgi:homoserine O-acetyltransferase